MTETLEITETSTLDRKVLPYDFRQETVLTKRQIRTLTELHAPIIESIGPAMGGLMRAVFKTSLENIEMLPARMLGEDKDLCSLAFAVEPAGSTGVLALPRRAALALVDRVMGGAGDSPQTDRPPTALEMQFVRKVLSWGVLGELCKRWPALTVRPKEISLDPADSKFAPSWEIVGRIRFNFTGLAEETAIYIWVPLSLMESLAADDSGDTEMMVDEVREELDSKRWDSVGKMANGVPVEARVLLGSTDLSLREISGLEVGDVVRLDSRTTDPLTIVVQGTPKLLGRPGLRNGGVAVQICDVIVKGHE